MVGDNQNVVRVFIETRQMKCNRNTIHLCACGNRFTPILDLLYKDAINKGIRPIIAFEVLVCKVVEENTAHLLFKVENAADDVDFLGYPKKIYSVLTLVIRKLFEKLVDLRLDSFAAFVKTAKEGIVQLILFSLLFVVALLLLLIVLLQRARDRLDFSILTCLIPKLGFPNEFFEPLGGEIGVFREK